MATLDRRQILRWARTGVALAAMRPLLRGRRALAADSARPRFFIQIVPQGGMDAAFSTDVKTVREVEHGIDVPIKPHDIVESHGARLGPGFRALATWMPHLAIVNAFRQNSANHQSGTEHVLRCKSYDAPGMPSLLEILGMRRDGAIATGSINIGSVMTTAFSPEFLGEPNEFLFGARPGLFEHLDQAEPDDLVAAAKAMRRDAEVLTGPRASLRERATANNLLETAELFARVAAAPKFMPAEWKHPLEPSYHNGVDVQRALWLIENQLTRCVILLVAKQDFDSHLLNTYVQSGLTEYLAFLLDKLFAALDSRSVDGRALSHQTVVIVGSEIGRFPRLNSARGKDHFPQTPHLFYGPGIATGASYGATGRDMASLPISLKTGRPEPGGHLLRVDDIGTTLLALDGTNPELYGYTGEHMEFLTGA